MTSVRPVPTGSRWGRNERYVRDGNKGHRINRTLSGWQSDTGRSLRWGFYEDSGGHRTDRWSAAETWVSSVGERAFC
jgi:hypothetical protein